MKTLNIIFAVLLVISCKAQTPIFPSNAFPDNVPSGSYLKDVQDVINDYNGTWVYSGLNDIMTLQLLEVDQVTKNHMEYGLIYEDYLVGEISYSINGVEAVNTLETPLLFKGDVNQHAIWGTLIVDMNWRKAPTCNPCNVDDDVIHVYLSPDGWHLNIQMTLHHYIENGQEKMHVRMFQTDLLQMPDYIGPSDPPMPMGEYVFIKQ